MAGLLPDDQMGLIMGLLSARQGDNLGLLFQQHANQQSQNAQRKQQMDMQAMQMAEMKRQQEQAGQMRGLAQRAFAPGQEGQGPMPDGQSPLMTGQGGGLPEYARGMMQIDPMQGMQFQAQMAQMNQKQQPKYHVVNGALVPEPTMPGQQATPVYQAPEKPEGPKKGQVREIMSGTRTLQYEWTGSEWKKIGEGPRFKPDEGGGAEKPPQGYRPDGKGGLTFIPGGPADPTRPGAKTQENPTEDERRSAGLAVRMDSALKTIKANPDSGKPEMIPSAIRAATFGQAEALPNTLTSSSRQQVESAQLDALDAALTLATGAAYTKDQLQNLRKSYFPQLGDAASTVKEKEKRFAEIIQTAKIRAGRASGSIDRVQGGNQPTGGFRYLGKE